MMFSSPRRPAPVPASIVAIALAAACGEGSGPTGNRGDAGPTIRLIAGANVEDTVYAPRAQALVVEVRDEKGAPRSGVIVRFEGSTPRDSVRRFERAMFVCTVSAASCGPGDYAFSMADGHFSSDSTDGRGRAVALLRHGSVAESSFVIVTVPEFGLRDSFPFRTRPGSPARVLMTPSDTALRVGASMTLGGRVVDRFMNPRPDDAIAYAAGSLLTRSGATVTATGIGRTRVVATAGTAADTTLVSIVPEGRVAGAPFYSRILTIGNFDGTDVKRLDLGLSHPDGGMRVSWRADGKLVAAVGMGSSGTRIHVVDPSSGAIQPFNTNWNRLGGEWYPMLSRADGRVYFDATMQGYAFDLQRLDANGVDLAPVMLEGASLNRFRPDISPDGTRIAVMTYDNGGALVIRVYDLATGTLIGSGGAGTAPRWSPDGQWIAYGSSYGGALRVMRPDGSGMRVVSFASYGEWIDWTADGQWLVASLGSDGGQLALVNVATGESLPLPPGLSGIAQPSVRR